MAIIDVTVRGAGVFGLAVGYACAKRGARVRVIDPRGVAGGCSGGLVGALAPHTPDNWNDKKNFQFQSLAMAQGFWAGVAAVSGVEPGYARLGRLQALADERAVTIARGRIEDARSSWAGTAEWRVIAADANAHWQPRSPSGFLVHDTLSARVHPRRACESLAAAITALGGEILRDGAEAGLVVHATGHEGLAELSAALGAPVGNPVKGQAALLRHDARDAPQIFAEGLLIVPHADGTVGIGSTSERDYDDPFGTDAALEALIEKAGLVCPILHGAPVLARWAGLRPRARSLAPMLGPWPGRAGHFVANGGFKIGFGMAPKVGEVMAALILDQTDTIPAGFRVEANL